MAKNYPTDEPNKNQTTVAVGTNNDKEAKSSPVIVMAKATEGGNTTTGNKPTKNHKKDKLQSKWLLTKRN